MFETLLNQPQRLLIERTPVLCCTLAHLLKQWSREVDGHTLYWLGLSLSHGGIIPLYSRYVKNVRYVNNWATKKEPPKQSLKPEARSLGGQCVDHEGK